MTEIESKILKVVTDVMKPYLIDNEHRILHSKLIIALNEALLQTAVSKSVCECINSKPMSRTMDDKRYCAVCRKIVEETVY
jgi:hypothetical protein